MSNKLDLSKELIDRRALVTGGTRGNGAAIAQRFLDAGATVAVAARAPHDDAPAAATFVAGDVSTSEGVDTIATKALAVLGGLDILVNNAGDGRARPWKGHGRSPTRSGTTASRSTTSSRSASRPHVPTLATEPTSTNTGATQ